MKKIITICILIACIFGIGIFIWRSNFYKLERSNTGSEYVGNVNIESNSTESEIKMDSSINLTINEKTYTAVLENNETAQSFFDMLPQEYNMKELNGNEKYIYLDSSLPTNSYSPNHIEKGDIMLYGDNCIVVFYKSFDTSYSYTKIGHVEDLPDLGSEDITIKFEKR